MSRAGLPGPFRRLLRQPLRVGAIALLATTALAASGIQSAAAMALRATMDENWRGLYDIVVTPAGGIQPIGGMLPPNTLSSTGDGLSLDDLAAVRGIDGIAVAAPVGEVVVPGLKFSRPRVAIPRGFVGASDVPQAFRMTTTYTTDDGLGERLVEQRDVVIVVDESSRLRAKRQCVIGSWQMEGRNGMYEADPALYPNLAATTCAGWASGDGVTLYVGTPGGSERSGNFDAPGARREPVLSFDLLSAPQTMTRITLVDPVAERELLGAAGRFLEPLIDAGPSGALTLDDMKSWADSRPGEDEFAQRFRDEVAKGEALSGMPGYSDAALAELRALFAANGDDWDEYIAESAGDVFAVPLLATPDAAARLSLKLDVVALGDAPAQEGQFGDVTYALPDDPQSAPGTPVGSSVADISAVLNPFAGRSPGIAWPGADLAVTEQLPEWNTLNVWQVLRPASSTFASEGAGVALEPNGYVSPVRDGYSGPGTAGVPLRDNPAVAGVEAAYAGVESLWSLGMNQSSLLAVPVGSFDATEVEADESAANYVPLGAYAPVSSTVSDGANAGTTMLPSLAGLGLVSPRTVAIASIESAPLWRGSTPISAIRVRVAGIDGYTPGSQQRVIEVARAIEDLGLAASIVAGSSPTDVDVAVAAYAFGTMDAAGEQTVGGLGTVTQRWSELGAAARVELSVSSATLAILGVALAAGMLLLGAVQVAGIPGRRRQAVIMREVGFTRARIARWFAAEEVPGLAIVAGVGAAAVWLSGGTGVAALAGLAAVATVLVLAIASVWAGSRVTGHRTARDVRSRRLGARSVAGFGARQALVHPLTTAIHVLAIVIVGVASAGLFSAVLAGREGAGQSSLALLATSSQLLPQLVLGAAGVVGGILLARLTRRLDLAERAEQWSMLRAAGWTSGQLTFAQRVEGVAIGVPALVLTVSLTWFGADLLGLDQRVALTATALVAGLLTAVIAFSTRRRGSS